MAVTEAVRLYSVSTVAERLDMSREWVYDRIADKSLPVVNLAAGTSKSKMRVRADDLQVFIDARSTGPRLADLPQ